MPHTPSSSVHSRARRTRDKDARSSISTGSKAFKRLSQNSPPQSPSSPASSLYAHQNITLDKLPPLPESGAATPASHTSRLYYPSPSLSRVEAVDPAPQEPTIKPPPPRPTVEEDRSELGTPLAPVIPSTALSTVPPPQVVPATAAEPTNVLDPTVSRPLSNLPSPPSPESYSSTSSRSEVSNYRSPYFPQPQSPYQTHNQPYDQFPTSPPPIIGYPPQNHYYPPPGTGLHYYPMQPSGYHQAPPFSPPHHPTLNGLGHISPGAFNNVPIQSPPLQRETSVGSKTHPSADQHAGIPPTPISLRSVPTLDIEPSRPTSDKDPRDLHHRVESYLPDIHLLLKQYRDAQDQLDHREGLLRKADEQANFLKQKEYYAHSLEKELNNAANAHSTESSKLRLEVGNLEEKHRELEENLRVAERAKKDLEGAKQTLEKEIKELQKNNKQEKESMLKDFDDCKRKINQASETDKRRMEEDFDKRVKKQEDAFETHRADSLSTFAKEKDSMRANWARQRREVEGDFDRLRRDSESKFNGKQRELEEALRNERDHRDAWAREREDLLRDWEQERAGMGKGWEEQREVLIKQHKKETDDLEKKRLDFESSFVKKAEAERKALESDKSKLKRGWDEDRLKFEKMVGELRSVAENLGTEKNRLQKMVETFGEVTDLKSKGDTYYIDAFSQLSKQIVDLSQEHFDNLPIAPPDAILDKIPSGIPSFTANTKASRQLRAAYVQHIVSTTLCYRVFQPFLFSLGRRYDKADTLFQAMSNELRNKSTRKEAVWRQHTLFAAYTASSAKKTINAAAGMVVEEIVNQIKHFADPRQIELINVAVRRIVKLAAEAWRLARLEREMITARMPAAEDIKETDEEWFGHDYTDSQSRTTPRTNATISRKLLLRLLPIISREPIHHDFRTEAEKNDNGCIYSRGVALYSDSTPVLARLQELQSTSNDRNPIQERLKTPPSPLLPTHHEIGSGTRSPIQDSNLSNSRYRHHRDDEELIQRRASSRLPGSFDDHDHSPIDEHGEHNSYRSTSSDESPGRRDEVTRSMSKSQLRKESWNEEEDEKEAVDLPGWGKVAGQVPGGSEHW
ncbi:MAG: hypothetical protein M1812_006678 [Candelaria pacifica]|nr:MAG: hypothetical protein M1812_006678 [Candelaria pacifica]